MMSVKLILCLAVLHVGIIGASVCRAAESDARNNKAKETWGPRNGNLQTRLVPESDHFVLGQPMRLRLELRNVGKEPVHYYRDQVDINDSLEVRGPEDRGGELTHYSATSFQTIRGKPPVLTPGNRVILFEGLDLDSTYLIVKPGTYSIKFKECEFLESNTLKIEVRLGELPPIKRLAARLLEVMPKDWEIIVHGYESESYERRRIDWDSPPEGWEPVRGMATIQLADCLAKTGRVAAFLWLSKRKLEWTGKVGWPGRTAAVYYGECPEGHLYVHLPSERETETAGWPRFAKDFEKATQAELKEPFAPRNRLKTDGDLERITRVMKQKSLYLDHSEITDAGMERIEGIIQLETLWLRRTKITDSGLRSLEKLPGLKNVFLDYNDRITDSGMKVIKKLTQLECLSLDETSITDAGLRRLTGLANLDSLSLSKTSITDAGMETIEKFTNLRSLEMDNTRITDAGIEHIKGLTNLERLSLAGTRITDAGLKHLAGLANLTHLDLDDTLVTGEGVARLQKHFPRCDLYYKSEEYRQKCWEHERKETRRAERESSLDFRWQQIPESEQTRYYIIQYDKAGADRKPLLVVVWKSSTVCMSSDGLDKDIPAYSVDDHLLKPPLKKAIYALQPDYSLKELPLAEEEIGRLFAHIAQSEDCDDDDEEESIFPPNQLWREKVDPHMKIVGASKNKCWPDKGH